MNAADAIAGPLVRPLRPRDHAEWVRLRQLLWPNPPDSLARDVERFHKTGLLWGLPTTVFVADRGDCRLGGFVEVSIRPFAQGCVSAPVAYIEGWFVEKDLRRTGIGRRMMREAEAWAQKGGCQEMGSDCWATNHTSLLAHSALGFDVSERLVPFRRAIVPAPTPAVSPDLIALVRSNPWVQAASEFVYHPDAGGIDIFLGTTRAEPSPTGKALAALDYEAYEEMAVVGMRDLAARARSRWPIIRLALVHRLGRVAVGEPSVVVAVSCGHRAEAFEACRWLIDTLKAEVPVWKKEVWADGSMTWVEGSQVRSA
jgi:molybdopterin synthase catalytic subunit